jgi:hypothetical protein
MNETPESLSRDNYTTNPEKQLQFMGNNLQKVSRSTAGENHSDVHLGLIIGFPECIQLVTTNMYNILTDLYNL